MLQVKIFSNCADVVEKNVNQWLKDATDVTIDSIQQSSAHSGCYTYVTVTIFYIKK